MCALSMLLVVNLSMQLATCKLRSPHVVNCCCGTHAVQHIVLLLYVHITSA